MPLDPEIDRGTYEATLDEVSRGWLTGPIPEEDLKPNSLVTRRFGVLQNNKIRPIDNYLESGLNYGFGFRHDHLALC